MSGTLAPMKRGGTGLLVGATAIAAPLALALESAVRWLLFPAEFEVVRGWLEPFLTPLAWLLAVVTVIAGAAGFALQRGLVARKLAKLGASSAAQREAARTQVFLITASIPQLPAIASTFALMFGASLVPTLVGVTICTVSVLAQGVALRSSAADA
ncbi:MAG: hypothetical protein M3Y87_16055 [Myxococcota bacterium]|nr:hypothetical protein [Myxococcota bacterium]